MPWGLVARIGRIADAGRSAVAAQLGVSTSALNGAAAMAAIGAVSMTAVWTGAVGALMGQAPRTIRTLPGVSAVAGPAAPAFEASIRGLTSPLGLAVSRDNSTLYVVEGAGERVVRRIRLSDGTSQGELTPPLTTPGARKPMSVAVRPDGVVYVVDQVRRTVDIYHPGGDWAGVLPPPGKDSDWSPLSVDVDADGGAYVTNVSSAGPVLVRYGPDERITGSWPSVVADGLPVKFPNGAAVTSNGAIVITDSNNARLVLLDPRTGQAVKVRSRPTETLAVPRGIAIDSNGLGLIADANDHTLSAWDLDPEGDGRVYQFGGQGFGDGDFLFPNDVVIDRNGRIYVADRDNSRVQIWR